MRFFVLLHSRRSGRRPSEGAQAAQRPAPRGRERAKSMVLSGTLKRHASAEAPLPGAPLGPSRNSRPLARAAGAGGGLPDGTASGISQERAGVAGEGVRKEQRRPRRVSFEDPAPSQRRSPPGPSHAFAVIISSLDSRNAVQTPCWLTLARECRFAWHTLITAAESHA